MKKIFWFVLTIIVGIIIWKRDEVSQFVVQKIIFRDNISIVEPNEYYKDEDFMIFKNVNDLTIQNEDDFNNFMYNILNNGLDTYSFFCNFTYDDCVNDFKNYIQTSDYMEVMNNYVNPFNSFDNIFVINNNFNQITINVDKLYTEKQITEVNTIIDNFIKENITDDMTDRQKIKTFHDWIINNTKYDKNFDVNTNKELYPYHPYNAYGPLVEGYAVCSGYSDALAIFLDKLGIKNYKISNEVANGEEGHVWNYVLIDNKWYHIDLTWDDPLTVDGSDVLIYDFFLITTEELEKKATDKHNFNKEYYLETQNS